MVSLEKLSTLETVVLLSQLKQKSDDYLRAWFYFAGKWSIIVFQFAVKWCRIKLLSMYTNE